MRVGPTAFSILPATLATKLIALFKNPPPLVARSVFTCFDSKRGLDNCKPICLIINNGPCGASVRNLVIRRVSVTEALSAPITPPLTNPSSNLVSLNLLKPLSTVLISVLM